MAMLNLGLDDRSAKSPTGWRRATWALGNGVGRMAIAILFLDAARYHVSATGWRATLSQMAARGIHDPVVMLLIALAASVVLSLALLFGVKERWAALGLALYTIGVSGVMYNPFAHLGQIALILFLKDLCIFGALLNLSLSLSGRGWIGPLLGRTVD